MCTKPSSSACVKNAMEESGRVTPDIPETELRIKKTESLLKSYNSPLWRYSRLLVTVSDKYNIPWTLIPAVSGVESGFCRTQPENSYNCWGWNNGRYSFNSYNQAINHISYKLKTDYLDKGLINPELISKKYAPGNKFWAQYVRFFMKKLTSQPLDTDPLQFTL